MYFTNKRKWIVDDRNCVLSMWFSSLFWLKREKTDQRKSVFNWKDSNIECKKGVFFFPSYFPKRRKRDLLVWSARASHALEGEWGDWKLL